MNCCPFLSEKNPLEDKYINMQNIVTLFIVKRMENIHVLHKEKKGKRGNSRLFKIERYTAVVEKD